MKCPKCSKIISEEALYHKACGWSAAGALSPTDDYQRCAWTYQGEQCRYPGSISSSTSGSGQWYCGIHNYCQGAQEGRDGVLASRDYLSPTEEEKRAAGDSRATAWLEKNGLGREVGETVSEYSARLREESRARFRSIGKSGHDWPEKVLARKDAAPAISLDLARAVLAARGAK